jgi:hypothetical protein
MRRDIRPEASVAALRDAMDEQEFDAAWAECAVLSIGEAIAYAQRWRGERNDADRQLFHEEVAVYCSGKKAEVMHC